MPDTLLEVAELVKGEEPEVVKFLRMRPLETFDLLGLILSNGISSPHNRGKFYGCRNEVGELEWVALIGHAVLFEARSEAAVEAVARLAQDCPEAYFVLGKQEEVERFWSYYSSARQQKYVLSRTMLYEHRGESEAREQAGELRPARLEELDNVVRLHAMLGVEERGVDPLEADEQGFTSRCEFRIKSGKTWVKVADGGIEFKAEVITQSPEVTYVEGVIVDPRFRGRGIGKRCLRELTQMLHGHSERVCVLIREQNYAARGMYEEVGYRFAGYYSTLFLNGNIQ